VRLVETAGPEDIDRAAQLWAEATCERDGESDIPDLAVSRPIIAAALDSSSRSRLFTLVSDAGEAVGLVAVEATDGEDPSVAELRYVAVAPSHWGEGLGAELLRAVEQRLQDVGFTRAELWVYTDNSRAVHLYERLGWRGVGEPRLHPRSNKAEQRYELYLV